MSAVMIVLVTVHLAAIVPFHFSKVTAFAITELSITICFPFFMLIELFILVKPSHFTTGNISVTVAFGYTMMTTSFTRCLLL